MIRKIQIFQSQAQIFPIFLYQLMGSNSSGEEIFSKLKHLKKLTSFNNVLSIAQISLTNEHWVWSSVSA